MACSEWSDWGIRWIYILYNTSSCYGDLSHLMSVEREVKGKSHSLMQGSRSTEKQEWQKNRKCRQECKMPRNNIIISLGKMRVSMAYVGQMNLTIWLKEYTAWMSYRSLTVGVWQDAMDSDRPLMDGVQIHPELLYLFVTGTKTAPGVVPFRVFLWGRKWMWQCHIFYL